MPCQAWYVYTHTDLEHWAKLIKKGKKQTEAYYSELKAQFEKDEKEKNEIATISKETTTIIHDNNPKLIDEITLKVHEENEFARQLQERHQALLNDHQFNEQWHPQEEQSETVYKRWFLKHG